MDSISNSSKTYPTTPGNRYAVAFSHQSGGSAAITVKWIDDAANENTFTLADGTATSVTATSGGWEIIAPATSVKVASTGNFYISFTPVRD
jgi:hypothetical protein